MIALDDANTNKKYHSSTTVSVGHDPNEVLEIMLGEGVCGQLSWPNRLVTL